MTMAYSRKSRISRILASVIPERNEEPRYEEEVSYLGSSSVTEMTTENEMSAPGPGIQIRSNSCSSSTSPILPAMIPEVTEVHSHEEVAYLGSSSVTEMTTENGMSVSGPSMRNRSNSCSSSMSLILPITIPEITEVLEAHEDLSYLGSSGVTEMTTENEMSAPGPSMRNRTNSSSSESSSCSSSSSTSSSSSSSGSTSTSDKDFSPDDTQYDPNYELPAPPTRVIFTSLDASDQLMFDDEETNMNLSTDNIIPQKKRRKGVINISKKETAKKLRNSGLRYTSVSKSGKIIPEKKLGPPCSVNCRLKCGERITQDQRKVIFDEYWKMGNLIRQREFVAKCISVIHPRYQYKVHNSNRGPKHSFSLEIDSSWQRVCKVFFKNTLSIANRFIATVIAKKNELGFIEGEMRGKHGKQNKTNPDVIQGIKNHINSIPRIESHYLRQQTTREYIDGGKNLTDLHSDYQTECLKAGVEAAKIHVYRRVFHQDFNISFHIPKKDQCELCTSYKNAVDKNEELTNKYDQHQLEKELCRQEKSNDKLMVQSNYIVACYDLQAVLPLPKGDISTLYYKCKLNVCNFTISELAKDYCECFVWSEVESLRGANEIATCVLKYLTKRAAEADDNDLSITFYSDNCCGQQKNQYMFNMYAYALTVLKIKTITHKYLISGHTQNENDAVHSVIEKAVKKCLRSGPIYTPDQYVTIIRSARKKGNPYIVNEMCFSDFLDIKSMAQACGGQFSKDTQGENIRMSDIKVIKFEKHQESGQINIFYKTSYTDTDFREILFYAKRTSRARTPNVNFQNVQLKPLNPTRLLLSERKNSDLKSLIGNNIIPQNYAHSYYNNVLY